MPKFEAILVWIKIQHILFNYTRNKIRLYQFYLRYTYLFLSPINFIVSMCLNIMYPNSVFVHDFYMNFSYEARAHRSL